MWIDKASFVKLIEQVATANAEAKVLSEQCRAHQTSIDWMRVRVNQLEMERAELFKRVTAIRIPVPEIQTVETNPAMSSRSGNALMPPMTREDLENQMKRNLNEMPSFEDPGNERAAKLGIFNNDDGTVRYE